jgi:undecaprenyl pyrophosphate phosphatase UppP
VLRNILGAVLGYVTMVVVVMIGIWIAWAVLGGQGAFDGEGPHPSAAWLTVNIVSGFVAAVVGGLVAVKIGRSITAVKILVGLMLLLGAVFAINADSSYEKREPVEKPVAEMNFGEAGRHAKNPSWYNFTIPLVGVAGALVGGRKRSA